MNTSLWSRARQLLHALGFAATALYGVDRVLRLLPGHCHLVYYRLLAQPLHASPRLPPPAASPYAFALLSAPSPALDALQRPSAVLAARFAQAAQCLVATRAETVAGCIWYVPGRYQEDEVRVDYLLPADCVWDFDVWLHPRERLGRLFVRLWDALQTRLQPQGFRYSLSRVNGFNPRSLASHRRLGARDCDWALFVCVGAAQLMLASLPPYAALGGRPQLRLRPPGQ